MLAVPGRAALVLRDGPSCVPLSGVVAGLASVDACHNAGQCNAGERLALLALVASFRRVESTYNRQQWHTYCLGVSLEIDKRMHAVELRDQARILAEQLGYRIRQEWLGGIAGGRCEIAGQKWVFVDLALSASDQLEQILEALRGDLVPSGTVLSPALSRHLGMRKSA